jgi:VWFA-related protein
VAYPEFVVGTYRIGTFRRFALALFCGLGGAIALAAASQDPPKPVQTPVPAPVQDPQRPVFRAGVDVVRVDVYPRRHNKIVAGLTAADFQLTEDGVAQTIETFEYIPIEMDRGIEPLDPRNAAEAQRMAADPRNRVFVFYLDTYEITMEGAYRAREPLLHFLQGSMGPRDLFAWMTPKHSPEFLEFTRMTQDLASVLTVGTPWGQKDTPVNDPEELKIQACAPPGRSGGPNGLLTAWRTHEMLRDLKELIIRLGALRQERKNLVILGERWQNTIADPFRRAPVAGPTHLTPAAGPTHPKSALAQAGLPVTQGGRGSFVPPSSPMADAMRVCDQIRQYLQGNRIFDSAQVLIDLARRNNVALYFIPLAPASLFNFSMARGFAEDTDGRSIVSNDIAASLDQVLEHQTGFYMLGYRSTAGEAGRKARDVRVKTTKDGVDLNVRRLYDPPPPEFLAARNAPPPPVVRTDVEKALDRLPPVRDDDEVVMRAISRSNTAIVTVEIAPRVAEAAPWTTGGRVAVTVSDEIGTAIASAERAFAAGERSVRLYIPAGGASKPVRARAVVTHANGATLADSVTIEVAAAEPIGTPVFYRAGSLPRLPFLPAGLLSFGRTERVRIEWPVAGALTEPSVRLLNAAGESRPTDAAVSIVDGTSTILRADLRVLSLAPGEYVVEVSGTVDGKAARHLIAIRVTR